MDDAIESIQRLVKAGLRISPEVLAHVFAHGMRDCKAIMRNDSVQRLWGCGSLKPEIGEGARYWGCSVRSWIETASMSQLSQLVEYVYYPKLRKYTEELLITETEIFFLSEVYLKVSEDVQSAKQVRHFCQCKSNPNFKFLSIDKQRYTVHISY
uniref:Uncharacterized protein n=1 Tax=Candidatus Methanogaster sp. ANME-2c ERB4 TaxID=2759911 RepID=A0A7G9YPB3_9EURY|nr:hypothetical protein HMIKAMFF_00007 [Methanosarcinales archaeon ANME-2c ERB4]